MRHGFQVDDAELFAWAAREATLAAARRFVERMERSGVVCVPVKGVVLAPALYARAADRRYGDVDVLVRPRDFARVVAIARRERWPRVWDSKGLGVVNVLVDGVPVDVAAFVGPLGTTAFGVDGVVRRATRATAPLGFPHLAIEVHDHALLMAIDAFKDKLGAAKPHAREDLVRLAAQPDFQPAALAARAREARLETMLGVVAAWVLSGGASPPWGEVLARLERRPLRARWAARYRARALGPLNTTHARVLAAIAARTASDERALRWLALGAGAVGTAVWTAAAAERALRRAVRGTEGD